MEFLTWHSGVWRCLENDVTQTANKLEMLESLIKREGKLFSGDLQGSFDSPDTAHINEVPTFKTSGCTIQPGRKKNHPQRGQHGERTFH